MRLPTLAFCLLSFLLDSTNPASADSFDSKGVKISYSVQGPCRGEPVVLLHGWLASGTHAIETPTGCKLVEMGMRVIAPDLRGHGESDKPHEVEQYGTEMVEDVIRLLEHLKIERAHFVGYSMGGMILTKLAVDYPQRVKSAVIGGSGGIRRGYDWRFVNAFSDSIKTGVKTGDAMVKHWDLLGGGPLSDKSRQSLAGLNDLDAHAFAAAALGWRKLEVSAEEIRHVRAPVLVIYGALEMTSVKVFGKELDEFLQNSELHIIPGETHMTAARNPTYTSTIVGFLSRHLLEEDLAGDTDFNVADRLAIQNVVSDALVKLDNFQIKEWASHYVDEGVFIAIDSGKRIEANREQMEAFFKDRFRRFKENGDQRRHILSSITVISQSGESVHVKASALLLNTNNRKAPELVSTLDMDGWLVRRGGVWKIKKWIVRSDTDLNVADQAQGVSVTDTKDDDG